MWLLVVFPCWVGRRADAPPVVFLNKQKQQQTNYIKNKLLRNNEGGYVKYINILL